jgi:perosamine synthetase
MSQASLPAVLGGEPVRRRPYPAPNFITDAERTLVKEVLDTGVLSNYVAHHGPFFNGGKMVKALEAEFAQRFGVRHAVSVNSATSGLHAAVAATLAGLGDEVIVPPYSMSATATAVVMTNATPVFADIHPDTFCLDPDDVRKKITPRTKAILAVNLFGGPAELPALRAIADEHKLLLIEDNAQSPGGHYGGKLTGTFGDLAVFSLNCHKTIQCGEGGIVTTNSDALVDRVRLVRNHGEVVQSMREETPPELLGLVGYNYRLTELQSAVALAQVRRLEELTVNRIEMANTLTEGLRGIDGVTPTFVAPGNRHVYYLYPIKIDGARLGLSRHQLSVALQEEGVQLAEGYVKPIYLYPMYDDRVRQQTRGLGAGVWHPREGQKYQRGLCPVTERMHYDELITTAICRADLTREDALEFVRAVEKCATHRQALRARLEERGIH